MGPDYYTCPPGICTSIINPFVRGWHNSLDSTFLLSPSQELAQQDIYMCNCCRQLVCVRSLFGVCSVLLFAVAVTGTRTAGESRLSCQLVCVGSFCCCCCWKRKMPHTGVPPVLSLSLFFLCSFFFFPRGDCTVVNRSFQKSWRSRRGLAVEHQPLYRSNSQLACLCCWW